MTGAAATLRSPLRRSTTCARSTGPAGVTATVAVQAAMDEAETAELLALAAASGGLIAGVVGWVDLDGGGRAPTASPPARAPGGERLAGIRHRSTTSPTRLARPPDVRRGLPPWRRPGSRTTCCSSRRTCRPPCAWPRRCPSYARARPRRQAADRGRRAGSRGARDLAALAAHEQVHCKLSGLVTEAPGTAGARTASSATPARLLELFGPGRLMFGSDWPVCTLAASYAEVLDVARAALTGCTAAERDEVLAGTARRFYSLRSETSDL